MRRLGHYSAGVLFSTILHAIVLAGLIMHWEGRKEPERRIVPKYINATLLKMEPVAQPKPKVDNLVEKRKAEARRRAEEQRKAEETRLAEIKRKKAEEQRKRKEAEELKRKKAEEARKKAEEDRKRREAEAAKQRQFDLARALEAEEDFLSEAGDAEAVQSYSSYIHDKVSANWSRPPSARRGMEVELEIQLVPTGQVVGVTVVKSSGNEAFDRSAELAVRKVGRFDRLKELEPGMFEQNFRKFHLVFRPEDLRM